MIHHLVSAGRSGRVGMSEGSGVASDATHSYYSTSVLSFWYQVRTGHVRTYSRERTRLGRQARWARRDGGKNVMD